jgi:hypothetical protein
MLQSEQRKNDQFIKDKKKDQTEFDLNANVPTASAEKDAEKGTFGEGALDEQLTFIRRQTIAVKAGNVQAAFVANLTSIQESVSHFEQMKKDSGNDIILQFQS